MSFELAYKPYGESAILIEWPAEVEEKIIQDIISFEKKISEVQEVLDTVIAYNSLTILYPSEVDYQIIINELRDLYTKNRKNDTLEHKIWQIPVCYDEQFGFDLLEMALEKNMSVNELIKLHSRPVYNVFFIGFQPGFLYLGGLDKKLHKDRKANPRLQLPKGSVGIGGEQTGIYPQDASGGWNIIGRTPIDLFDVSKQQPCFAKAGDKVQFTSVSLETFGQIKEEIKQGAYQLKFQQL